MAAAGLLQATKRELSSAAQELDLAGLTGSNKQMDEAILGRVQFLRAVFVFTATARATVRATARATAR